MFQIGQKVVCITKKPLYPKYSGCRKMPEAIKVGGIYTIRDIDVRYVEWVGEPGIRLEEFLFPPSNTRCGMIEPAFAMSRFRPVLEKKTDISIFTEMLRKQPSELLTTGP